jgi:hypothetical protein
MGINDYFLSLSSNRTVDETAGLVPHVVGAIRSAITVSTLVVEHPASVASAHLPIAYSV